VLAGVAPLTVAAGVIPTAYATTGLTGIPAAFVVVAVILGVFAEGYVAMARHVTNAGAFYALIARGAGRPAGVAAAAFHDLAPSRWLIADPEARSAIFPGYFRLILAHAMAAGLVHTTPGRDAVALWLPAGPGVPGPLAGRTAQRLPRGCTRLRRTWPCRACSPVTSTGWPVTTRCCWREPVAWPTLRPGSAPRETAACPST
jgi:hypothetical protein